MNERAKSTQPKPSPGSSTQQSVKNASRTRSPRGRSPSAKWLDCRARITSKELAPLHSVKSGTLQNACSTRPRVVADLGKSALMHSARLMSSLAKRSTKNGDKSAVSMFENYTTNWVAYFKIWSRRSLHRFCGRAQTY